MTSSVRLAGAPLNPKETRAMTTETASAEPKPPVMEHVHTWFSLSYSNYAVLPRTLLQSMPDEWQDRFVKLIGELEDAYDHIEQAESYEVRAGTWQMAAHCTDGELKQACVKGPDDEYTVGEDGKAGRVEDYEPMWFRVSDGATLTRNDYVFIPGAEPVPHYNRGRTYIAPRLRETEEEEETR